MKFGICIFRGGKIITVSNVNFNHIDKLLATWRRYIKESNQVSGCHLPSTELMDKARLCPQSGFETNLCIGGFRNKSHDGRIKCLAASDWSFSKKILK
jgi:hypothetical protein